MIRKEQGPPEEDAFRGSLLSFFRTTGSALLPAANGAKALFFPY